ncbi:MAG TPA: DUF3800 domain-containing protein [Candidatus Paceibacterota bacterium]|nr:DUF3800 domain-containing protein [Candidatus Paceibacterota bacterium]
MSEYLLYLDESGVANLAQYSDKYFIISTLTVESNSDSELSGYLKHLKRRYGFSETESLHAFELFEDKNSPIYIKDNKKCKQFTESLTEFIENASFEIGVYVIDKSILRKILKTPDGYKFKGSKAHSEDKDFPYEILAKQIIFDYANFLKKNKGMGSIIAESRGNADSVVIRSFNTAQSNNHSDNVSLKNKKQNIRDRIHSICFANKKSVRAGLELVDIISYCTNLELSGKIKKRDSRGIKHMWEKMKKQISKGTIHILTKGEISGLNGDKIHKISERIQSRMKEFRDLVNPTAR